MRSIPFTLVWEIWQQGRWSMLLGFCGANFLPVLLFTAIRQHGPIDLTDPAWIIMQVMLTQINMFIFGTMLFSAQGNPSRLFVTPVTTARLVTWHLIPAMLIVAAELILSHVLFNTIFGLNWPIWGPALFSAAAVAAVYATLWQTEKSAWLPLAMTVVAGTLGLWYNGRHGSILQQPRHLWTHVTLGEVLTLLAVTGVAWYAAINGVARTRRGDEIPPLGIVDWFKRMLDLRPDANRRFADPVRAQLWYEWRKKGWGMPCGVLMVAVLFFTGWVILDRKPQHLFDACLAGGFLLSVLGMIGGLIMGNTGPNDSTYVMGHFLGTRPMTNVTLARTVLKMACGSVLLTWAIWALIFLVVYLVFLAIGFTPTLPPSAEARKLDWWYFPATLLGPWMICGVGMCLGLTGQRWKFAELTVTLVVLLIGLQWYGSYALTLEGQKQMNLGLAATAGVLSLVATIWLSIAALGRKLIAPSTIGICALLWLAGSALVMWQTIQLHDHSVPVAIFIIGVLALAVAPLPAAPLAIGWNRNR